MKKWMAILLAIMLMVSLLPVAVLAEGTDEPTQPVESTQPMPIDGGEGGDEPSPQPGFMSQAGGLYLSLQDGVLSGYVDMTHDSAHYYQVSYTTGESKTVYYWDKELTSLTVSGTNVVSVSLVDEAIAGLYCITLASGASGTVDAQLTTNTGGGFPVIFSDGTSGGNGNGGNGGGDNGGPGLYRVHDTGKLSGYIEMTHDSAHYYEVGYEGGAIVVYYWHPELTALTYEVLEGSGNVTVTAVQGDLAGLYAIELTSASGLVCVQFEGTHANGTTGFPINFDDGTGGGNGNGGTGGGNGNGGPGLYRVHDTGKLSGYIEMTHDSAHYYEVGYEGGAIEVYYWHPELTALTYEVMEGKGDVRVTAVQGDLAGLYAIELTSASGLVCVQFEGTHANGTMGFPINFDDGTGGGNGNGGNGGGDNGGNGLGEVICTQHPLQDSEKLPNWEEQAPEPSAFTYKGETYYMSPIALVDEETGTFRFGGSTSNGPSGTYFWHYAVGFWKLTDAGYALVEEQTRAELMAAFGDSLSMELYAIETPWSENYRDYAQCYPKGTQWEAFGWPCGVQYVFTDATAGGWVYEATGTIEGKTVTCSVEYHHEPRLEIEYSDLTSIADVNAALEEFAEDYANTEYSCIIQLPAGELQGIIRIPEDLFLVCFYGARTGTTIQGGIEVDSRAIFEGIDFEGAGKSSDGYWARDWGTDWNGTWNSKLESQWHKKWPNGSGNGLDGENNYAIWGKRNILFTACSFSGYYHAIQNDECISFGSNDSVFVNNAVAIYFDTSDGIGGNLDMIGNEFRNNACAIWIQKFSTRHAPLEYHVVRCKFINNPVDIANRSNAQHFFVPGNYFEWNGTVGSVYTLDKNVHSYPSAKNASFTAYDYGESDATVANALASSWLIPQSELEDKTITVMGNDCETELATWSFGG